MSRFNTRGARPSVSSPVTSRPGSAPAPLRAATATCGPPSPSCSCSRSPTSSARTPSTSPAARRDDRYTQLIRQLAVADPAWTAGLLGWLRSDGNMRTASIVGAAEFVKARLDATAAGDLAPDAAAENAAAGGWNRRTIASVLKRANEPGELLAYWTSRYGRRIPKPVKRGIEDAVGELYTERNLLKYDTDSKGFRFGDVIELVHPSPKAVWQGDLFKHAIDRRHNRDNPIPDSLQTLHAPRADLVVAG
jgi:hypothetical protein